MFPREHLTLWCPRCGPVVARLTTAVLYRDRTDGRELLEATCPGCASVLVTAAPALLRAAGAAAVPVRPLVAPRRPVGDPPQPAGPVP